MTEETEKLDSNLPTSMEEYLMCGMEVSVASFCAIYFDSVLPLTFTHYYVLPPSFRLQVLDHAGNIPKKLIKACAGILLLKAQEAGFGVSAQGGNGVALAHKDGKWSNPVCVNIISGGVGAVFGYANKSVVVLLNQFTMNRLLEGNGSIDIGVDAGFAVGKTGRAASADIELSNTGGLGSSLVYTYSKGVSFQFRQ